MSKQQAVQYIKNVGLEEANDYFIIDNECEYGAMPKTGVELISSTKAKKSSKRANYYGQLIKKYNLKPIHQTNANGYFIQSGINPKSISSSKPILTTKKDRIIQKEIDRKKVSVGTCLLTTKDKFTQNIHNVIVAQEGSELNVLTSCIVSPTLEGNTHNAISEIYVKKNAKLTFTMIHSWNLGSRVFPQTIINVEEGGQLIYNYVSIKPIGIFKANPLVFLTGDNSHAQLNSFLYIYAGGNIDLGGTIYLNGDSSRGVISSNAIVTGGKTTTRGTLIGNAEHIKAHLECKAIVLEDDSEFRAIPTIKSLKKNLDMSHEANIGKLSLEEIEYLQTKGFSQQTAENLLIQGFLNQSLKKLPASLRQKVKTITDKSMNGI